MGIRYFFGIRITDVGVGIGISKYRTIGSVFRYTDPSLLQTNKIPCNNHGSSVQPTHIPVLASLGRIACTDRNDAVYCYCYRCSIVRVCLLFRDDNGSAGHGSQVKWVNKSEWVTWVASQYS